MPGITRFPSYRSLIDYRDVPTVETLISLGSAAGIYPLDQFPSSISRHPSNNYRFFLLARQASGMGERNRKLNKSTEKKREVTFGQTRFDSCQTLQAALQMHVQPLYGFSISFTLFSPSFCGLGEESRA